MTHRTAAWLHSWLTAAAALVVTRLRAAPERGQGTVEYVALILLVAAVLAVAVAAAKGSKFRFDDIVAKELKQAIEGVGK